MRTFPVILLLSMLLLSGCGAPVRVQTPPLVEQLHQMARALEAAGDYQTAAEHYLRAAQQAHPPEEQDLRLYAAGSLIRGGEFQQAESILDGLATRQLPKYQQQHFNINRAELALSRGRPAQTLEILESMPAGSPWLADFHRLRALAYLENEDFIASVREYILLDQALADPGLRLTAQLALWGVLTRLTDADLQQLRTAPPPDALSGWLELVELTRLYLQQPDALAEVVPHWQMRYPGHPASEAFIAELLGSMKGAGQTPQQLALLLPLGGSLSGAATAVRDGLLAAYYDTPDISRRPTIKIYDTGDNPESVMEIYQQAVADGAGLVIGPLRKEAVQALAFQDQLAVPVLALNHTEPGSLFNNAIYQFGLAPEDEAREVARRARRDGHSRGISLIPQGDWGARVYDAFLEEWQALGGEILEGRQYNPAESDHGQEISTVLNLDQSRMRYKQLVRQLGRQLDFEPRRRQDIDFIFILATPGQARLIRPQLSFYRASRVPVYSTAHVYSGQPDKARDTDMNGLIFCDMPWTLETDASWRHLREVVNERWPANSARYTRLYALGIDAWHIIPYLDQLGTGMFGAYHGVTGNLTMDARRQLHRSLRCARFQNGLPVLLEATTDSTIPVGTALPADTAIPR